MYNRWLTLGTYQKRHIRHGIPLAAYFLLASFVSLEPKNHVAYCLVQRFAGLPCPLCGLTRALGNLYHGNMSAAWELNPVSFVFLPVGAVLLAYRVTCVAKPRRVRIPLEWELAIYYGIFGLFILVWTMKLIFRFYA